MFSGPDGSRSIFGAWSARGHGWAARLLDRASGFRNQASDFVNQASRFENLPRKPPSSMRAAPPKNKKRGLIFWGRGVAVDFGFVFWVARPIIVPPVYPTCQEPVLRSFFPRVGPPENNKIARPSFLFFSRVAIDFGASGLGPSKQSGLPRVICGSCPWSHPVYASRAFTRVCIHCAVAAQYLSVS